MSILYLISKLIKKIHLPAIINSNINRTARVCTASQVVNVSIGKYSYIGNQCTLVNVQIGNFCSIADNCIIGGASHPINWVSTSPVFHNGKNIMRKNFSTHRYSTFQKTIIGNDVWLGNNCLIKSGVTIGNGSIIGMGSIVTKDIGEYEIWGGNPARFIRKRFDDETSSKLIKSHWWEWEDQILQERSKYFNDINLFLREMESHQ